MRRGEPYRIALLRDEGDALVCDVGVLGTWAMGAGVLPWRDLNVMIMTRLFYWAI